MLDTLISSKTRVKLLLKFFLNTNTKAYLRGLEAEFGESSNAIRIELNRLEKAGMLRSELNGNKKIFSANTQHPLFAEVHNILLKHVGLDQIIDQIIERLGNVEKVYLAGRLARGLDSRIVDLILIGQIDRGYLLQLIHKAEQMVKRKIRYLIYDGGEWEQMDPEQFDPQPLLLWSGEKLPHG